MKMNNTKVTKLALESTKLYNDMKRLAEGNYQNFIQNLATKTCECKISHISHRTNTLLSCDHQETDYIGVKYYTQSRRFYIMLGIKSDKRFFDRIYEKENRSAVKFFSIPASLDNIHSMMEAFNESGQSALGEQILAYISKPDEPDFSFAT